MLTQPIKMGMVGRITYGPTYTEEYKVILYGTYYHGRITTGKTAIESISKMLELLK